MKLKAPGLPPLPNVRLEVLEDLSPKGASGFLRLRRRRFRAHYPDGSASEPFEYDEVDRRAIDAAVMLAHYEDARGVPYVYLRSASRLRIERGWRSAPWRRWMKSRPKRNRRRRGRT